MNAKSCLKVLICGLALGETVAFDNHEELERVDELLYDEHYLEEHFRNPWRRIDSRDHVDVFDERADIFGVDDCGMTGVGDVVFLFGGKSKFGKENIGRIFEPNACICLDDDFDGCETGCPEDEQVHGVWRADTANANDQRPSAREDHVVVSTSDEDVYVFGGIDEKLDVWHFSLTTKLYTEKTAFGNGRKDACGAVIQEKVYLFGGVDAETDEILNDIQMYDPKLDKWTTVFTGCGDTVSNSVCPFPREDHTCVGIKDQYILVVGGANQFEEKLNDTWIFDVQAMRWTKLDFAEDVLPGNEDGALILDEKQDRAILQGGSSLFGELDAMYVFHFSGNAMGGWYWQEVPLMDPAPLVQDHCSASAGGKLFSFSGEVNGREKSPDLYIYELSQGTCPHDCVGKGQCIDLVCVCDKSFDGPDCNTKLVTKAFVALPHGLKYTIDAFAIFIGSVCTVSLVLYFVWRNKPGVRATSPILMCISIIGCMLACLGVVLMGQFPDSPEATVEKRALQLCYGISVIYPVAFGLVFGAFFAKLNRVGKIFLNKKLERIDPKKSMREMYLICVTIFAIEILLVSIWFVLDHFHFEWVSEVSEDAFTDTLVPTCGSERTQTYILFIALGNGLMLAYGAYLAWITRHIKVFADSPKMSLAIYNLLVISLPTIFIAPSLSYVPRYVLSVVGILIGIVGILVLLIIPNLLNRNRSVASIMNQVTLPGSNSTSKSNNEPTANEKYLRDEIASLHVKISQLQQENESLRTGNSCLTGEVKQILIA